MKSYAEREIFTHREMAIWCDAVDMVKRVRPDRGNEVRCHELTRAVQRLLWLLKHDLRLVDGKLRAIEHSWLLIETPHRELNRAVILDVYCPGRLPQVQLIDSHFSVANGYEPGEPLTDIKLNLIGQLIRDMERPK